MSNVFYLPNEWKIIPTTTVDIYVASVRPIDLDKTWCSQANFLVKKRLQFAQDCKDTLIVNVSCLPTVTCKHECFVLKFWSLV